MLGTASSNPQSLKTFNNILYFQATDLNNGSELWKSDGTEAGTQLVKDIEAGINGSAPKLLVNSSSHLFFTATTNSFAHQLWRADGTDVGTSQMTTINVSGDATISNVSVVDNNVYFTAIDENGEKGLWRFNTSNNMVFFVKLIADNRLLKSIVSVDDIHFLHWKNMRLKQALLLYQTVLTIHLKM